MTARYWMPDAGQAASILLALLIIAALDRLVVATLGGAFSYSLDDPYIHLAVAENILHGHYGINSDEASAPSSSILFPFLLAPFLLLGFGQFGPLVINIICTLASILIITKFIRGDDRIFPAEAWITALVITFVLAFAFNLFGAVFTGMEHSLHITTSLLVLYGLIRAMETDTLPAYLVVALIVNPLVRFEGLALTFGALFALALAGRWRGAAAVGLAVVALVGGFMAWLVSMGLEPLPSSVLVKAKAIGATVDHHAPLSILKLLYHNVFGAAKNAGGMIILIVGTALTLYAVGALKAFRLPLRDPALAVAIAAVSAIAGHLVFGRYGWFARYELYIVFTSVFAAIYVFRAQTRNMFSEYKVIKLIIVFIFIILLTPSIWIGTRYTAIASKGIYLQQHQMHRLAAELYGRPVAVNDLGWVSFRNPHYVLDVWGLGSERARKLRAAGRRGGGGPADWADDLAAEKGTDLIMIYRSPGETLPSSWTTLGVLSMDLPFTTAADSKVYFFATARADRQAIEQALAAFEKSLPPGAVFTRADKLPPAG